MINYSAVRRFPFQPFPYSPVLPFHASFFGRVDLRKVGGLVKEEALDVVEKEILRVRVSKIQPVMVDDLGLFL